MSEGTVNITKASGKLVPFSEEKLRRSLASSGANAEVISRVIDEVKKNWLKVSGRKKYTIKLFVCFVACHAM